MSVVEWRDFTDDYEPVVDNLEVATEAAERVKGLENASYIEVERALSIDSNDALSDAEYVKITTDGSECEPVEPAPETPAHPESPANLKDKIHIAREVEWSMRQKYQQAKERTSALEMLAREQGDHKDSDCACAQCASWSEVPAPVEDYFQLECNAFVRDERIKELELERKDIAAARARVAGSGDQRLPTYEQFESSYKQRRQELVEALAIEHYRLSVQRNVCLAQNFDPERFRYRRF